MEQLYFPSQTLVKWHCMCVQCLLIPSSLGSAHVQFYVYVCVYVCGVSLESQIPELHKEIV